LMRLLSLRVVHKVMETTADLPSSLEAIIGKWSLIHQDNIPAKRQLMNLLHRIRNLDTLLRSKNTSVGVSGKKVRVNWLRILEV
jgi:hypothetical protein